ncbi:MAG: GTP-binding protein [Blautia sp.]|nr:GTP-binding protein [Blautia sp.]
MNCPIDLYAGLLGCGKTTLIRRLLETEYRGKRVAVIENEIGKVNLDGIQLTGADPSSGRAASGFSGASAAPSVFVREITGGCVCCTVQGEFTKAVDLLVETVQPDCIVIEPTGAADITGLLKACRLSRLAAVRRLVMLVNARKFLPLISVVGSFYLDQIRSASCIYLNFTERMTAEGVQAVREKILEINKEVKIIDIPMAEISEETFSSLPVPQDKKTVSEARTLRGSSLKVRSLDAEEAGSRPVHILSGNKAQSPLVTWTLEIPFPLTQAQFELLQKELENNQHSEIWRAKGILPMVSGEERKLDFVFGDLFSENTALPENHRDVLGKLVLIGKKIDTKAWEQLLSTPAAGG